MRPAACLILVLLAATPFAAPARAGVATPHRLSFQGIAHDAANQPVYSGNIHVRVYDAPTAGNLVYDSGTDFDGAIVTGVFNVVLGSGVPLMLDDTVMYYLEMDVNGQEVVGDAAGGRQAFWPAGGDQSRSDLETRIQTLEDLVLANCTGNQYDLNGNPADGCEFTLDSNGIYVDVNAPGATDAAGCGRGPGGTCTDCQPCRSITQGLAEAQSASRSNVYVANGIYDEAVTLVNGKNLRGGYRSLTWERDLASTATQIRGVSVSGAHRRTIVGSGITSPTLLEGFVIFGPVNPQPGGNSYAVFLSNAGQLTMQNNVIIGGVGGAGSDGAGGAAGANGVVGGAGGDAIQSGTSTCSGLDRAGGTAGSMLCGATDVSGGAGGGNQCSPISGSEFSGIDGTAATGAGGGAGGDAGDDGQIQSGVCTLPPNPTSGAPGGDGTPGIAGTGGTGGANAFGSVLGGNWLGSSGFDGGSGGFGRGGGGGGAGGGSDGIAPELDVLGGAGGGGGSGGCGGGGGSAGSAGGGSFGVFVTGVSAPAIVNNQFFIGYGGNGGRGGAGGISGAGGLGGVGGASLFYCCGAGGHGGGGGAGGAGGGGGGGAGGIACGIFASGVGAPNYGLNTFSGGAGGTGGSGGASAGNPGTAGVQGPLSNTVFQ